MMMIRISPQSKRSKDTVARQSQENPFVSLRSDIDRLFDNFFRGLDVNFHDAAPSMLYQPRINISDNGKEIKVVAELPGMQEKDIDVSLTGESVTIRGEKKDETVEEGSTYHHIECSYGAFTRTIALPVEVNVDGAKAKYRKGVLTITIPKSEKALQSAKKIPVRAN